MCATILYHNKLQQMCLTKGSSMTELQELRRYRRDLHRIPELDFDLPQTIAYIEGVLAPLTCEVTHPCPSCVCAFFDAGVDAAHATAIREHPGAIRRNVLFVFQPAEETTGGAKTVCESGVFERYGADRIFGFHVWPDLPAGTLASCSGPLLARSSETHIHIHGTSIHIAKTYGVPVEESHDAALAAAKFLVAERELMDELGTDKPCIGKFGLLQAGTVCNAVAGEAHVAGSLRVFTDDMFDRAREGVRRVLDDACAATGCTYDLNFAEGYPPVDNDPELFASVAPALPGLQLVEEPLLIAEDFAFYQRHLPGVFFLLGTGMPEDQDNPSDSDGCPAYATSALHTDSMLFDEEILLKGLDVYKRLLLLD